MARPTHPRRNGAHKAAAADVFRRHAAKTGKAMELPVRYG
jgi:hypothetical protein